MPDEVKDANSAEVKQDPPAATRSADPAPATVEYNAAGVLALGEAYEKRGVEGSEAKAKEAIRHGHDEAWLRAEIEGLMDARVNKLAAEGDQRQKDMKVGLSEPENRKFSLSKLVRAMAFPENRTYQTEAGLELEACAEARKRNQSVVGYAGQGDMSLPQEFYEAAHRAHEGPSQLAGQPAPESGYATRHQRRPWRGFRQRRRRSAGRDRAAQRELHRVPVQLGRFCRGA